MAYTSIWARIPNGPSPETAQLFFSTSLLLFRSSFILSFILGDTNVARGSSVVTVPHDHPTICCPSDQSCQKETDDVLLYPDFQGIFRIKPRR